MAESLGRSVARPRIEDLERAEVDDRSYRIITLSNQLEVLLIHDATTDKASAAMDVNVGSFSDAEDMPGIAHAVEHLLFMGTEKYPEENNYNKYLTSYSGHSNAYTAATSTNYYFELAASNSTPSNSKTATPSATQEHLPIDKEQSPLWGALDRFGQFFICPLFLEDTVDREIKAVDSENKKNLQSDTWRLHQLSKNLANPKHPYNHFSTGSWKTLHDDPIARGVQIRDEFMKFHATHYSANRMKLVVLGRENLDTLEEWVEEIFSKVPNKDLPRKRWDDVSVYTEKELLIQTFAKPVFESRSLEISFLYRDEEEFYESHPSRYLSHLIGHEGPGSILAYIKAKGWANGLGAGGSSLCPGSGIFNISVKLTEDGLAHYKDIVKVIFQYIAMMRELPPQEWVVEEQIKISEVEFRFKQKSPPSRTTSALASVMQKPYNRKDILSGPSVIKKFHAQRISEAMEYLRPENFRMTIVSQEFPGDWDQKEKWYGTDYKTEKIPQDFLAEIRQAFENNTRPKELHLPHKNEFIPNRLEVERKEVGNPAKQPKLIRNDDAVRTWWKKDDQFWVPKANVHIHMRTPMVHVTPRTSVLATLYANLVDDALVEYAYDADISGLNYGFSTQASGISVSVSGYNDKLHVLLEKVLLQIRDLVIKEDRFKIVHDKLSRSFRNWHFGQPFHQVGTYSRWFRVDNTFMNEELAQELETITAQEVQQFFPQVLSQGHIEILAHGNLYKEEALKIADLVERTIKPKKLPASQWPIERSLILPEGSNFIYSRPLKDPANVNHCIEYTLYLGNPRDEVLRAKQFLLAQMVDEPTFNQLRTIEQLGYVVFSGSTAGVTYAGFRILVQSERDCGYLEGRIDNFLTKFETTLKEMSNEEFEKHKSAVISKRLETLKNLGQEGNRFWNHMFRSTYDFLQADIDAAQVATITKDDMISFYMRHISPSSPHRAKLSVHLTAQSKPKEPTLDEKKTQALAVLQTIANEEHTPVDASALQKRLDGVTATQDILEAVAKYLTEDLKLGKEDVAKVADEAAAALGLAESGVGQMKAAEKVDVQQGSAKEPVLITDVRAFKAGLFASQGVKPVKNLEEFMEDAAKL
ncbi:LuxS/MPP-like metallohydrolase [Bimuria novae-zelandiae CBS 107.79]|uniref:LuxS/MPP-like metallohydrolase n=1 Tax=Bimuria novae-zelandiae CBS 107.79 TaxID=1447943 RepID=A0A6A5UXY8_9PLEO|nr:LuxS/MPP-like metallohydrolase [Bimuria novae-zelandiae CBS 107.79]